MEVYFEFPPEVVKHTHADIPPPPATRNAPITTVTAASLLLYSHANGDSPGAIRHRHADVSSHFVLRLACCGRGSTISINDTDGSSSHGSGDGTHVGRRQDPGGV